jgi:hypothetical protein
MRCEGCFREYFEVGTRGGTPRNHHYCSIKCRMQIYRNINQRKEINDALIKKDEKILNNYRVGRLKKLGFKVKIRSAMYEI